MNNISDFLAQAQHVQEFLERGQYAQARMANFRLVCTLRTEMLEQKQEAPGRDPQG